MDSSFLWCNGPSASWCWSSALESYSIHPSSADAEAWSSVNSMPVVFYHFHKFLHLIPETHIPLTFELYKLTFEVVRLLTIPYLSSLLEALTSIRSVSPQFSEGFDPQGAIDVKLSFIAHASVVEALRTANNPYREIILNPQWTLFASDQGIGKI